MAKKVKGSFLFKITGDDGTVHEWLVDLKTGNGSVTKGNGMCLYQYIFMYVRAIGLKGDCSMIMKDSDFMDMVTGKIGAQKVNTILSFKPIPFSLLSIGILYW